MHDFAESRNFLLRRIRHRYHANRAGRAWEHVPASFCLWVSPMSNQENDSDAMRRQIAELLDESRRLRIRSDELAKRIAELKSRIEKANKPSPPQSD